MLDLFFAVFVCCAVGAAIGLVEQKAKTNAAQVYAWLFAGLVLVLLGVAIASI